MLTFRFMDEDDVKKFERMIPLCLDLNLDFNGTFSMYKYKDQDRCLYYDEGYGLIFSLDGKNVIHRAFSLGKNFEIEGAQFDGWFYEYANDIDTVVDNNTGIRSSLIHYQRQNGEVDRDKINGVVAFVQYNPRKDKRVTISYQQYKGDDSKKGYVFESTFNKDPFAIAYERNVLLKEKLHLPRMYKRYIRVDGRYGEAMFDILTIHDYGLIPFLREGSYNLQKSNSISRYYRIINDNFRGYTITTYPIGIQHSVEDMKNRLSKDGFSIEPSKKLIDLFNCVYGPEFDEFMEVAQSLKALSVTGTLDGSTLALQEKVQCK
jgi:hypothetical protein